MKKWIVVNKWIVSGALLVAIGGYTYYHFVGCASGTCMITSRPFNSIIYFGLVGALFFSLFKKERDGKTKKQ
jgi:phage shock protein E